MTQRAFHPRDGALLDLEALQALAEVPHHLLDALLTVHAPGASGLILEGLELSGDWTASGPPGSVRPDGAAPGFYVSPGSAIVTDATGVRRLVRLTERSLVPWPTAAGVAVRGVLSIGVQVNLASGPGGLSVAREEVEPALRVERLEVFDRPDRLPLAVATGNGLDWATDLRRILPPEHPVLQKLVRDIEGIERAVWEAEPEGAVWEKSVIGRSWVRYQTIASAALQAGRMVLDTQAMSTLGRVRTLASLRRKLEETVPSAANRVVQLCGPSDLPGPWRRVLPTGK